MVSTEQFTFCQFHFKCHQKKLVWFCWLKADLLYRIQRNQKDY